jgi:Glucose / Sorbosone dehydrogenase
VIELAYPIEVIRILRCRPDGSELSLVAWGLRNAYGLGFLPDGRLIATEQSADARGSRSIGNAPDSLYVIEQGAWYGWPDFVCGRPVTDPAFKPQHGPQPRFILADHDRLPPPTRSVVEFAVNAAATEFAVLPAKSRWPGPIVVALFSDEKLVTAPRGQSGRPAALAHRPARLVAARACGSALLPADRCRAGARRAAHRRRLWPFRIVG